MQQGLTADLAHFESGVSPYAATSPGHTLKTYPPAENDWNAGRRERPESGPGHAPRSLTVLGRVTPDRNLRQDGTRWNRRSGRSSSRLPNGTGGTGPGFLSRAGVVCESLPGPLVGRRLASVIRDGLSALQQPTPAW
jgi:hypothetical protein